MNATTKKMVQPGLFGGEEPFHPAPKIEHDVSPSEMPAGKLVQVAPNKWAMRGGPDPEYIIAEVFRHPDGTLGFRPSGDGRCVKLSPRIGELLGFSGQLHTIRRLARAGFIRLPQPSPCVYLLDLDSWFRHVENTESDPDFWDSDGPNLRRYLMANGLRCE